jgi:hypothetical protein
MHLKLFVTLKKTLKTLSSGPKNRKKTKNQKTPKKPTGLVFFIKKNPGFIQPCLVMMLQEEARVEHVFTWPTFWMEPLYKPPTLS